MALFNRTSRVCSVLFVLFVFSFFTNNCWALQQLRNSNFSSNHNNWTCDNRIYRNNLQTFSFTNSDGKPSGCFRALNPRFNGNNVQQDGIIQQTFTTPPAAINAVIRCDHKDSWNASPDRFSLRGTINIDGSSGYPNETAIQTFLNHNLSYSSAGLHNSWQSTGNVAINLNPATTYIYRIYFDTQTDNNESAGCFLDNMEVNFSPSGLTGNTNGALIDLSWAASTGDVALHPTAAYRIYRSTTSIGPWSQIGTSITNSFSDTSPPASVVTYYTITDRDVNNVESPRSHECPVFRLNTRDGNAADVDAILGKDVAMNWDVAAGFVVTRYEVALGTTPGGADVVGWTNVGLATSHTFAGQTLTNGQTYYTSVRVVDATKTYNACPSDGFVCISLNVRDGAGADVDFISSLSDVDVNWDTFSMPIDHYEVALGTTPGGADVVGWTNVGTSISHSFSGLGLSNGTLYYCSVKVFDPTVTELGVFSSDGFAPVVSVSTTVRDGNAADVDATTNFNSIDLNWDAIAGFPVVRYEAALGTTPGGSDIKTWTDMGLATNGTFNGLILSEGVTYYCSVRIVHALGTLSPPNSSDGFQYFHFEVRDGTGADIDESFLPDTVQANWDTFSMPVSRYDVAFGTTPGGTNIVGWTNMGTNTSASFSGLTLVNGTTYYCTVRIYDSGGSLVSTVFSDGFVVTIVAGVTVRDGLGPDISDSFLDTRAELNWDHPTVEIIRYEVAVGTTPYGTEVSSWNSVGHTNQTAVTGISLASGTTYFASVRGINAFGSVSALGTSNGFTARRDPVFTDTNALAYFNNARVLENIDLTTTPGSIRPRRFGSAGGNYWRYKALVTVTEPGITSRINAPCRIQLTVPNGQMGNVREIRVSDEAGNEIPRHNLTYPVTSSRTNPDFVFLVNLAQGETKNYWVYWGNPAAGEPAYGFTDTATNVSSSQWTPFYSRKNADPGNVDVTLGTPVTNDEWRLVNSHVPWDFYFFGENFKAWRFGTKGFICQNNVSYYTSYTPRWDYFRGASRAQNPALGRTIAPAWLDLWPDDAPQQAGIYRNNLGDRVVYTWRTNRYGVRDDIYIFQAVLYQTGDISFHYDYLSTLGILGPNNGYDRPINTENTAGISRGYGYTRWLTNTPLVVGIGKTPSAFFQCADAFRGNYTVGPIQGGGVAQVAKFESMVFDSRTTTPQWNRIEYDCVADANNRIVISTRSGPTPLPELGGWTGWVPATTINSTVTNGNTPLTSSHRYIQYQAVFQKTNNGGITPRIDEVRFIAGTVSVEEVIATTPNGVSQGQDGIPIEVKIKNTSNASVNLDDVELTFDLGTYNQTLTSPALPVSVPSGGIVSVFFTVDVDDASAVGTATIHASATADTGAFTDEDAQLPHFWQVKRKAELVINQVETSPNYVNKGQNGIPVRAYISNIGEVPYRFDGATLTFSLGDYSQTILSPAIGTIIPENSSFIATISVNVLLTSPSGVSIIGATASGTNTFSNKITDDAVAAITDSWTIQNPAQLVLEEVTASSTVYRGQTNTPVFLRISNPGEAIANWESSDLLSHFTLGTYDAVYPVSSFPIALPGGLQTTARYGVDISPVTAVGNSNVDADITGTDNNTLFPLSYPGALIPASWTILAEKVNTYKDGSYLIPSASFNRPSAGTIEIYAKGEEVLPFGEFLIRWMDPSNTEVAVSPVLTADASGTIFHELSIDNTSSFGNWKVQIANPVGTVVACENTFEVVSPADLSVLFEMPSSVSVGQQFIASLTFVNSGGAEIDSGYVSSLDYFGLGTANLLSGPDPSVIHVAGNGQATTTYRFAAISPGNFSASATAYGFDANSGDFLTSPAVTSNVCTIQTPPALITQSITAVPTTVYLNQKNLSVNVVVRNNGQATAVLTAASLSFDLGSHDQSIVSPALPYSLTGGSQVTFTYDVSVLATSATGLSTFHSNVFAYDNNNPNFKIYLNTAAPDDSWTIAPIGIYLSRDISYTPLQDDFNRLQTVYIRCYGFTPLDQWFRVRVYNYEISQSSPAPTNEINVSPQLSADGDGFVDHLYTVQATDPIGTWSVVIDNGNAANPGNLMGLQYFRVQNQGNIQTQLAVSPASVFVGEEFTVTMVATNTVAQGSTIQNVIPSALTPSGVAAGSASLVSGPTPANGLIEPHKSQTYSWTYKALTDTGLAGSYSLTSNGAHDAQGEELNTGAAITSNKSTSNSIIFYNRSIDLSSATLDFGSRLCGDAVMENTGVVNTGNYPLDMVRWISTDLNGPGVEKISKMNLDFNPAPVGTINSGVTVPASASFFVPYNQVAGNYIATMSLYNDRDLDGSFDIDEVYDLFQVKINVPPCKRIFFVEDSIDLGGWSIGQSTLEVQVNAFSGGNLPLDNLKFKQTVGTNTFPIIFTPGNPGAIGVNGSIVASVTSNITVGPNGEYVSTWTIWNDEDGDDIIDSDEAKDTIEVKVQVGGKSFSLAPDPIHAGVGTPSTVITGFGPDLTNTGMLDLSNIKPLFVKLDNGSGDTIASEGIAINPALAMPIADGATVHVPLRLFIPAGTPVGTYSGIQTIYEDNNNNDILDGTEAFANFELQVSVPQVRLIQVLISTVDLGGVAPGTSKIVSFPCRNTGNVTLTDLRWEKRNLQDGANTINATRLSFPPVEPFIVAGGDFFYHDIQISVPLAQSFGNYLSVAPNYWIYDDYNPSNVNREVGDEPDSNFRVRCQIGEQKVDILEATLTATGDPNGTSSQFTFNIKNTGSLALSKPKATATILIPSVAGPSNIPSTANIFAPVNFGAMTVNQVKQSQWSINIPANTPAGIYNGQCIVWEDANNNNIIDPAEASDTASLQLIVDAKKVIEIVQTQVDLGWASENSSTVGSFEVRNAGNLDLTSVDFSANDLVFGFTGIASANISFSPDPLGPLTVGTSALATVTVIVGANQADGTYAGIQTVYDDYNPANTTHDGAAEESTTFELILRIGRKGLYEQTPANPDVAFGSRDPGAVLTEGFPVFNSTAIPLSAVKCKVLSTLYKGSDTIATASISLTPATPLAIGGGSNLACQLNINCPADTKPGDYTARLCLWEDDSGTAGVIDTGEASATFNVTLTVKDYEALDIIEANYDFGQVAQGEQATKKIGIRNVGNVDITGFSWSFSDLVSGGFTVPAADFNDPGVSSIDPLKPGDIASYDVSININGAQEPGVYGPNGPQLLTGGGVNDSCTFSLEVLEASTNGTNLASGTIEQEIATETFPVVPAPAETYILSAWVCPGTGTASIGFVQTKKESGKPVTISTYSLTLNANGNLASSGGLTDSGIIEKVPFKHPDFPLSFYFYRIYMTFDYCFDSTVASNTHIFLQNKATGAGDKTAVWFDGIQLEKSLSPNFTKPTSYHPFEKLVSPTRDKTLEGIRRYYEW